MRNGQQKRMRGRNNRRSSNPLTRVYESNGPDVKVRGTAHHIAEKYQQLARDAQSSGDPVAAENYLQHAEHYLRLIASLQGQFAPQLGYGRDDEGDEDDLDDVSGLDAPQPFARMEQPFQPRESREPREGREGRGEGRPQRESRPHNFRRNRDEDGGEGLPQREAKDGREGQGREPPPRDTQPREAREPREYRASRSREDAGEAAPPRASRAARGSEEPAPAPARSGRTARAEEEQDIGLPSFITGAPAVAAKERVEREAPASGENPEVAEEADAPAPRRRRRFRTRAERAEEAAAETGTEAAPEQQVLFGE